MTLPNPQNPLDGPQTPEDETDRIMEEALEFYKQRTDEEAYKKSNRRESLTLEQEVGQLSASLNELYKEPHKWRARIAETEKLFEEKCARLEEMGVMPKQARDYRLV